MNDPGALLKVRYTGGRSGAFAVTVIGITRHWSARALGRQVATARWLPKAEAEEYRKLPDFVVIEQKTPIPPQRVQKKKKAPKAKPKPPAVPVEEYVAKAKPPKVEFAPFVMSRAGIVHRRECSRCPKVPIAEFDSLTEAREHSRFSRFHRSCVE